MYSYTASIFWYLSWPVLIFIAFHLTRWAVNKFLPLIENEEMPTSENSSQQTEPSTE
ncbi:MAG: hypothetical protein R6T91_05710 [Bacteroidales bacterium]